MILFTIGHSNHSIEAFMALLHQHGVTVLADVRSHPYSRYVPHFNPKLFKPALVKAGIRYVFLGQELGARPDDSTCYVNGKALYERIAGTVGFTEGLQRILHGAETYRIALMCAEKDPITCHRAILVCQHLRKANLAIHHILADGELESHAQLEERLLHRHGFGLPEPSVLNQLTLFDQLPGESSLHEAPIADPLQEAYRRQGEQIAYVEKQKPYDEQSD